MIDYSSYMKQDREFYPYDELRHQTLPLYVWGAGDVAFNVVERLKENAIEINGYIVKDGSITSSDHKYDGKPLLIYQEALSKDKCFNVILGFSFYERIREIENMDGVNKVFYILNPYPYEGLTRDYYLSNKNEIDHGSDHYDDEESKEIYQGYIKAQLSNDLQYLLDVFDSPTSYFDNEFIRLSDHEDYVDVGAYDGDTVELFLKQTGGKYSSITAIEADPEVFQLLENNLLTRNLQNLHLINQGAYDTDGMLYFMSDGTSQNGEISVSSEGTPVRVSKLDTITEKNRISDISFVKINFTRSTVIPVLDGAKKTLSKDRPKLAIIAGLYDDTIYKAPEVIKRINPDYKVYLRLLTAMPARAAIFAVAETGV